MQELHQLHVHWSEHLLPQQAPTDCIQLPSALRRCWQNTFLMLPASGIETTTKFRKAVLWSYFY